MVVGDRGASRLEGLLVGSVTVALTAHAECPVVVVRGPERDPAAASSLPVVVGVDGSPTSEAAIAFAYEAAAGRRVPLVALHPGWTVRPTHCGAAARLAGHRDRRAAVAGRAIGRIGESTPTSMSNGSSLGTDRDITCWGLRIVLSSSSWAHGDAVSSPG